MAMLAGARSLHARPWERRYTHALGRWFERGRLNAPSGDREGTAVSPRSLGGHRVSPLGDSEDSRLLQPSEEMQGER